MGINGLHKGLSFCRKKSQINEYAGQNLAVDCSSWLHKSVYSVSERYVESTEARRVDPTCVRTSARYISARCGELINSFGIARIYLVLDGERCPMKAGTNQDRESKRQANLEEARAHKRRGDRFKSSEKYKACIKIRADFTAAVMESVSQEFRGDDRVELVWSPYEADAQLAKLCVDRKAHAVVTEDSDVLVYSAACRAAFPIIFKLDRGTGSCDVISMDWFLSPSVSELNKNTKKGGGSSAETILKGLALKESRRPGYGSRLFVQACVLSGCDYTPNGLVGIGLITALKYIRDNSFRDHDVRFGKVLLSLPSKARDGVDMEKYEKILARSEAVFYHHPVLCADGTIAPLSPFRVSDAAKISDHLPQDHLPCIEPLGDVIDFLGKISGLDAGGNDQEIVDLQEQVEDVDSIKSSGQLPPISEIVIRHDVCPLASTKLKGRRTDSKSSRFSKMMNPYKKQSERKANDIKAKKTRSTLQNPFAAFALNSSSSNTGKRPVSTFHHDALRRKDFRFVKRQFPPTSVTPDDSHDGNKPAAEPLVTSPFFSQSRVGKAPSGGKKSPVSYEDSTAEHMASTASAKSSKATCFDDQSEPSPPQFAYGSPIRPMKRRKQKGHDLDEIGPNEMIDTSEPAFGGYIDLSYSIDGAPTGSHGAERGSETFEDCDRFTGLRKDDSGEASLHLPSRGAALLTSVLYTGKSTPDGDSDSEDNFGDIVPAVSSSPMETMSSPAGMDPFPYF